MKAKLVVLIVALAAGLPTACAPATVSDAADVIFERGRIYTVDETLPWADAVAVKDGRIVAVGDSAAVAPFAGPGTEIVDLEGRFMMPGVLDLHAHPFITPWYGTMNLTLDNPGDADAILEQVRAYAEAEPERDWIIGGQWLIGVFPDDSPRREDLDAVVADRPVALLDQTGHSMWLNSRALEEAGITADTPTNQLIVIEKDAATGEPTGTIREQALQLVERVIPQANAEEYAPVIEDIFEMFLSYGVTGQQTAEGHRAPLEALRLLEAQDRLEQRVFVSWDWKTTLNLAYTVDDIETQIANRADFATDYVYPNYVKFFADGGPGARTSLLLEPYEGEPDFYGAANMTAEEFAAAFIRFDNMGVGLHIHAMGDGTIRRVVDALEMMKEENGDTGVHHKVAHNTMLTLEDIDRLAALQDVNVDFSPPIWYPHAGVLSSFVPAVGEERYQRFYPIRSAIEAGLHVGQGADWLTANPTPNPFIAIEGMVTRRNPFDPDLEGTVNADEAITLEQALVVATLGGASVLGVENDFGSISPGKFADMIVLDRDLFEIDPGEIDETVVLETILGGQRVYVRSSQGNEDVDDMAERAMH